MRRTVLRVLGHVVVILAFAFHATGCYSYAACKQLGSCNPADGMPVKVTQADSRRPLVEWDFESRAHHEYGGTRRRHDDMRLKAKAPGCERPVLYALAGTSGVPQRIQSGADLRLDIVTPEVIRRAQPAIWTEDCALVLAAERIESDSDTQKVRLVAVNRHGTVVAAKRVRAPFYAYGVLVPYLVADVVYGTFVAVAIVLKAPVAVWRVVTRGGAPGGDAGPEP